MQYFKVRNFEQFQHYTKRNPPWIKLYYRILHDRRFFRLDDASKWIAVGIFLLASQNSNKIPADPEWIAKELSLTTAPDWQILLEYEFIQPIDCDASNLLHDLACDGVQRRDREETEAESERESETEILSKSQKSKIVGAGVIFKHWNSKPSVMHHRSISAHEKAILKTQNNYTDEEIILAIDRYDIIRENKDGKYRDLYFWTLSEFLTLKSHYNIERLTCEQWEKPFIDGNGHKPERRARPVDPSEIPGAIVDDA